MKEYPILFSGPMVRAILEGRKTQTRRIIRPQPTHMEDERRQLSVLSDGMRRYGRPGDLLWVREQFRLSLQGRKGQPGFQRMLAYRADGDTLSGEIEREVPDDHSSAWDVLESGRRGYLWHPSIHMPRWASRLTLRLMEVRVQRVKEISHEDARAEGMQSDLPFVEFIALWDSINAKRPGCSWENNPWVWALTFAVERTGAGR